MLSTLLLRQRLRSLRLVSCFFCLLALDLHVVKGALKFTVEPQSQTVRAGKPVIMRCTATATRGTVLYSWTHKDTQISKSSSRNITSGGDGGVTLYIPQVDMKRDRGVYQCIASKKDGNKIMSQKATLTVQNICEKTRITTPDTAIQGREISLRCRCSSSSPTPAYSWTKDGQPVTIDGSKIVLDGKILKITNLDAGDNGAYSCKANNNVGTSQESDPYQMNVIVGSLPVFKVTPEASPVVKKGDSKELRCSADGKPTPVYEWRKGQSQTPLTNDSSFTVMHSGNLLIKSMDKEMEGMYKCTAKNVFGSPTVEGNVRLAYIEDITIKERHLAPEGQPFELICNIPDGVSKPKVEWLKSDGSPVSKPYWLKNSQTLAINKTTQSDDATFKCIATNEAGSVEASVEILVAVPPNIIVKPQDTHVKEGETIELVCKGTGKPQPRIMWARGKEDTPVKSSERYTLSASGSKLTISNSEGEDSDIYKCRAIIDNGWHDDAMVNVTVFKKVRMADYITKKVNLNAGNQGKLRCSFDGHGPIKVEWRKEGMKKLPARLKPDKDVLHILQVKEEDAGDYYCTGSNSFSNLTAKIRVSVFVFPKFDLRPKNTTVHVGSPLWMHCNATGKPKPKISWGQEKVGGNDLDKSRITTFANGTLYVREVQLGDNGKWYCIAANGGNWQQVTITLKVTGLISAKGKKQAGNMGRTIGIAIGCAAAYIVLVVGLMIYCKGRRAAHASKKEELHPMNGDIDNKEDGINELTPMYPRRNSDKMQFPRHDLEALRTVGNGSYGRAFIARASGIRDGEKETMVVVKALMSKDDIVKEDFTKEIEMLANLCHDNIVCLLGVCREVEPYYMIFEHLEKGDLKQMLVSCYENGRNNFTSSQKLAVCGQVVNAMRYLNANDFTHKDLAARNCVVGKDLEVKVGFLSLSYDLYNAEYYRFNNMLIPLRWMAPEAIFDDEFSEKSDVWSFGVLIWEIYTLGSLPYHDRSDEEVLKCVRDDLRLPQPDNCPDNMVEMMRRCWQKNPDHRPTLSELADEISSISVDSHV